MIFPHPEPRDRPYDLEEKSLSAPALPGAVAVALNVDRLVDMLAAEIIVHAKACVREFGDFELALSGGSTPLPLYERLMYDPDARQIPWVRTHLWQVDERAVAPDHEQSNFKVIRETIVDHSGIPDDQVHPMDALSETGHSDYEKKLREVLEWRVPGEDRLDFVLLGMGEDGHTASLFPNTDVIGETERLVARVIAPAAKPPVRVTLTYPAINAARFVAIMVTGAAKAAAVQRMVAGVESVKALPISGVRPQRGQLKWFLDAAAAGVQPK